MFSLTEADLKMKILGVGDGSSSFNSELTQRQGTVVSFDPLYHWSKQDFAERIQETYDTMIKQVSENKDSFVWETVPSVEALGKKRLSAMDIFLRDYEHGKQQGRYVDTALPLLPFENHEFDLAICSHLLFLYSKKLSQIFHILDLSGKQSPYVKLVQEHVLKKGFSATIENVDYEFQRGGNQMLRIKSIE